MRTIYSPIFVLLMLLIAVEFFMRFPFVLWTLNSPAASHSDKLHFFSIYPQVDVTVLGLTLLAIAFAAILGSTLLSPARINAPSPPEIPHVPASIYVIALFVLGCCGLSIALLGAEALAITVSGKRSDLSERGLVWGLLKVGNFAHIVIVLLYLRYLKYGGRFVRVMMVLSFLGLFAISLVFSQRAVLISLVLAMLYASILFGRLRLRTAFYIFGATAGVVIAISALRTGQDYGSLVASAQEGLRRAMQARYFFDFAKLGTVLMWAEGQTGLFPAVVGFMFEPFMGDQVTFYKEVGPMISSEVYLIRRINGVTPGLLLESILSFGYLFGMMFFITIIHCARLLETRLFKSPTLTLASTIVPILVLSKFNLALNSSLGAYTFQLVLEGFMLALVLLLFGLSRKPAQSHRAPLLRAGPHMAVKP